MSSQDQTIFFTNWQLHILCIFQKWKGYLEWLSRYERLGDKQFMTETKKIKQHKKNTPSSVDGHNTPLNIANHCARKYDVLFNSCTSNQQKLDSMW